MRAAFVVVVFAVVGCVDRPLSEIDPVPDSVEKKTLPVSLNRELDLLFVIDNSGSMAQEHTALETRFPELIARLDELGALRPDLHIGVVTSDMGTGTVSIGDPRCDTTGGDGGRMHGATCAALGGNAFITDVLGPDGQRVQNYSGTLDSAFACAADVGIDGCGFEQHLASMQAALSPGTNPGFLRRFANLGVIILADEDDCSTDDDRLFGPTDATLGPRSDYRCFEQGVVCDPVADPRSPGVRTNCRPNPASTYLHEIEQYAAFLRGVKEDPDQVLVAAIVGDRDHVEVIPDGNRLGLRPGCTGGLGDAAPAIRLGGLVDAFGARGHLETICTGDLGAALASIAGELLPSGACFESSPEDRDHVTPGLQPECAVVEILATGATQPLPACAVGGPRPCWQIAADPQCVQTPEHARLDIDRGGNPPPPDAYIDMQCVVSIPVPPPQ